LNMVGSARVAYANAERAARAALALDSGLVDAQLTLSRSHFMATADHERAIKELTALVGRAPDYAPARLSLRHALVAAGRYKEALEQSRRGVELDPYSPLSNTLLGVDLVAASADTEAAMSALRRAIDINERFSQAFVILGSLLMAKGNRIGGADSVRLFLVRRGYPADKSDIVRDALAGRGSDESAVRAVDELAKAEWEPEPRLAGIYAMLGDTARAIDLLEAARVRHVGELVFQRHQPFFASLRGNPRFEAIWAKNGW